MNLNQPKAEDRFKENINYLSSFLYELCEECSCKGYRNIDLKLIGLGCDYITSYTAIKLIEDYVYYSARYWDFIKHKSVEFFEKHIGKVFGGLPLSEEQLEMFKILHTARDQNGNPYVSEEDLDLVWEYLHACTIIAINYLFDNPDSYKMIKVKLNASKRPYDLDLIQIAKTWNINRELSD